MKRLVRRSRGQPRRESLGVSVPVMITKRMETDLRDAGYSQEEINTMTPQQAHNNIAKATRKG
jgi:hypothetical protein